MSENKAATYTDNSVVPRTPRQQDYLQIIERNTITFCTGPAGTGKTHLAIGMAIQALRNKEIKRIVITRPVVHVGRDMGFLPGGIMEKLGPYVAPCFDELAYYIHPEALSSMIERKVIVVEPLQMMRGRTFKESYIIMDEAQNATMDEVKMFLTRLGSGSKMIFTGDPDQTDLYYDEPSGLLNAIEKLSGIDDIESIKLEARDIVRHKLISKILTRL